MKRRYIMSIRSAALCCGLLWSAAPAVGQVLQPEAPAAGDCGTRLTLDDVARVLANEAAGLYQGPSTRGGEHGYVPVTMHVVRRSNGTGGLPESRLSTAIDDVNGAFAPSGMVFYRSGPTRYIHSDDFYFNIDTLDEINALRQTDVVAGSVNVYYTENLATENGDICGMSSFTTSSVQGIVMKNGCTAIPDNHATMPHEVGHYFDLFHTHETTFGLERVIRTNCHPPPCPCYVNCTVAGDLLCDTPADPGLSENVVDSSCVYTGAERDTCENRFYVPDARNLMSYSPAECRDAFTTGQDGRARATLETLRTELAALSAACSAATFVNGDFPDGGTGTPFFPYETFDEGVQAAPDGDCIIISPGSYPAAPITLSRPMTLHAPLGPARIETS